MTPAPTSLAAAGVAMPGHDGPRVDPATRRRRLGRLAGALLLAAGRITVWSAAGVRTQRRVALCSASGVLVALGVRVQVVNPAVPWPRTGTGHLVASDAASWLDQLALLIAVRATPVAEPGVARLPFVGGLARRLAVVFLDDAGTSPVPTHVAAVTARLRRGEPVSAHQVGPDLVRAAVDAGAPVCPVAIRYRGDGGPVVRPPVRDGEGLGRGLARVVATRGLVVEAHLLPSLEAAGSDPAALSRTVRSILASVPRAGAPVPGRPAHGGRRTRADRRSCTCVTADTPARRSPQRSFTLRSPVLGQCATCTA